MLIGGLMLPEFRPTLVFRGFAIALVGSVTLAGCAGSDPARTEQPVALESMFSAAEFRDAGLDQLSDRQLETLNALLTRELTDSEGASPEAIAAWERSEENVYATFGLEAEHPRALARDKMETRLAGEMDSWETGDTIALANGQVWEVVVKPRRMFGQAVAEVPVTVRRASWGSFLMDVGDKRPAVRVRRIE
jgi:hypothetical protein